MQPRWRYRCRRLRRWVTFAAILGLTGCVFDGGRVPIAASTERWSDEGLTGRRIVTEHFDVRSTIRDAEFDAALPQFLESAYLRYEATLPPPDDISPRLSMYVFGTRAEWARFTRRHSLARYEVYSRIPAGGFK